MDDTNTNNINVNKKEYMNLKYQIFNSINKLKVIFILVINIIMEESLINEKQINIDKPYNSEKASRASVFHNNQYKFYDLASINLDSHIVNVALKK
jgi:hypothetical protein